MFIVISFLIQAQFSMGGGMYSSSYGYGPWSPYGDRSCPVDLLNQLSMIVSTLYGYGTDYSSLYQGVPAGNPYGAGAFAQGYSALSGRGYQTSPVTGNPFNPVCPWPLINGMISQIQTYVNQLQSAQTGTMSANNPYAFAGVSPLTGRGGPLGGSFGAAFGRPFKK